MFSLVLFLFSSESIELFSVSLELLGGMMKRLDDVEKLRYQSFTGAGWTDYI